MEGQASCSLKHPEKKKKDEALLGLASGRGIQCGRGCPASGSLRSGTEPPPQPPWCLVSSWCPPSPPPFDPLCSLRCRRLPTKADPTTPRKGLEMQQPLLHLHPVVQRAEVFLAGQVALDSQRVVPSCSGHRGESRWGNYACCRLKPLSARAVERYPPVFPRPSPHFSGIEVQASAEGPTSPSIPYKDSLALKSKVAGALGELLAPLQALFMHRQESAEPLCRSLTLAPHPGARRGNAPRNPTSRYAA